MSPLPDASAPAANAALLRLRDESLEACLCHPAAPFAQNPNRDLGLSHDSAAAQLQALRPWLIEQQHLLRMRRREALLIWLQGPDCAGKDGAIERLCAGFSPLGLAVHSFGRPTVAQCTAPFLARYRQRLPEPGQLGLFNRTPYEGVASDLFDGFIDAEALPARLIQLADFEDQLAAHGIRLLKVYLQISQAEQHARLRKRLLDPRKHWKLCADDLTAHRQFAAREAHWAALLRASHRPEGPWYILPANHKWLRDLLLASLLARAFETLQQTWPTPAPPFTLEALERG